MLNIVSLMGLTGLRGTTADSSSKFAVVGLPESLAQEETLLYVAGAFAALYVLLDPSRLIKPNISVSDLTRKPEVQAHQVSRRASYRT